MKTINLRFRIVLFALLMPFIALQANNQAGKTELAFWLKEYIPAQYPEVKVIDNKDWYQAVIPEIELVVSWAYLPQEKLALKEVAGVHEEKSIFISDQTKGNWEGIANMTYTKGAGYYISAYSSASMGYFEVAKLSVVQFDGNSNNFVEKMKYALLLEKQPETETQFTNWLKDHIPAQYPGSEYRPHNVWYQVFISEFALTVSWGLVPHKKLPLKEVEGLFENKSIFIAREAKEEWTKSSKVDYYPGVGYHIAKYNSSAMGNYEVGQVTVIQFDGKPKKFIQKWEI